MTTVDLSRTNPGWSDEDEAICDRLWGIGAKEFNPDQERDDHGRWTSGGEGFGSVLTEREKINAAGYFEKKGISVRALRSHVTSLLHHASPEIIAKGMAWYSNAHQYANELGARFGVAPDAATGVLAALSPQVRWAEVDPHAEVGWRNTNQDQAERVLGIVHGDYGDTLHIDPDAAAQSYKDDLASKQPERHRDALDVIHYNGIDESRHGENFTGDHPIKDLPSDVLATFHPDAQGTLRPSATKAFELARGKDPDEVLSGNKVRAFYNNMTHPESDDVTIDGHQVHLMAGTNEITDKDTQMMVNTEGKYEFMEDAVRAEAAKQNMSPMQLQAISWLQWREEHPAVDRREEQQEVARLTAVKEILALGPGDPEDPEYMDPDVVTALIQRDNATRATSTVKYTLAGLRGRRA